MALLLQGGQITEETQSLLEVVLPISNLEHVSEAVMQAHLLCRTQARLALQADAFMFCTSLLVGGHLLRTASSACTVTALLQAAVALLLPPLADAELFGEALEEYFVRDADELRDQAAAAQLKEQARALKAQAGAVQDVPAAVAKLQQAWPLPEALTALQHALQETPAESLDGAGTAKEQQVPIEHVQAAGPATQESPAQRLQAAGPAPWEQQQMHAEHLHSVGPVVQDRQEPPATSLQGAKAVASSRQQAQLGRPPTNASLAHQPSGGDEQQQSPVPQSAPQQGICGEQQGHEEETISGSIQDTLQRAQPEPPAGGTQTDGRQHAAHPQLTPAGDSAAKPSAQEHTVGAGSEAAGLPAVPAIQTCATGLVEAQGGLAVAQGSLAESNDMPRAPKVMCNSTPGSAQVGKAFCKIPARRRALQELMPGM